MTHLRMVGAILSLGWSCHAVSAVPVRAQQAWRVDPTRSVARFHVTHLLVSTVTGTFGVFEGRVTSRSPDLRDAEVEARVDVRSVRTGDDERDADLRHRAFLDAAQHPFASFRSTGVSVRSSDHWELHGALTIRGEERPVTFAVRRRGDQGTATYIAEATIDRFDWGLRWNRVVEGGRVVVGREVRLEVRVVLVRDGG